MLVNVKRKDSIAKRIRDEEDVCLSSLRGFMYTPTVTSDARDAKIRRLLQTKLHSTLSYYELPYVYLEVI